MHWPVPVAALRALVPRGMELDLHEGKAYVGVVPFAMEAVRPRIVPRAMAMDFLETNLRTYVTVGGEPGVYFFSLEAASRLAVIAARVTFGLPYFHARMRLYEEQGVVTYETVRSRDDTRHAVRYRIGAHLGASPVGTFEHFLIERYLLFVERDAVVMRGQVHHPPYDVHLAEVLACDDQLVEAAGLPAVRGLPPIAHYSPGVDVEVFALAPALV